jgi:hypothetical protein
MLAQIKNSVIAVSSTVQFKIAVQVVILALMLIAALVQPEVALAGPSWGNIGG